MDAAAQHFVLYCVVTSKLMHHQKHVTEQQWCNLGRKYFFWAIWSNEFQLVQIGAIGAATPPLAKTSCHLLDPTGVNTNQLVLRSFK